MKFNYTFICTSFCFKEATLLVQTDQFIQYVGSPSHSFSWLVGRPDTKLPSAVCFWWLVFHLSASSGPKDYAE